MAEQTRVVPLRMAAHDEAGFTLIETVVALSILLIVIVASLPLYVGLLQSTGGLGSKQTAVAVAAKQLEYVRSITPTKLVAGRYPGDVATLIASPGLVDLSGDLTTSGNSDSTAASGSASAAVPLTSTQTLNGTVYTVRTYVDVCYLSRSSGLCTASSSNGGSAYRVSIDVSWPRSPGVECASGRSGQCEMVLTTLLDASDDPVFSTSDPPTITSIKDATYSPSVNLTTAHPGQQIVMLISGTSFVSGATVYSGKGDVLGPVSNNTGTSLNATVKISTVTGTRSLSVVNPNGASASQDLTIVVSSPTISALSPATAVRAVAKTFTVTGTDFFATPTRTSPTTLPTISMSGTATILGSSTAIAPTIASVSVTSGTSLTFQATFPTEATGYTTTGTLTLTNPDGGVVMYSYSTTVT